jgi:hypothetical protein
MFCLEDFCACSPMTKQGAMVLPIVTYGGSAHLRCTGFGSWPHRGRSLQARQLSDYSGWPSQHVLADQRWRLSLTLLLVAAWASVVIALIRDALQPGIASYLASHLGPLPIPQWLAFVFSVAIGVIGEAQTLCR